MPPRYIRLALLPVLLLAAIAVMAACGGGDDDDDGPVGNISDPNNVPTATPWQQAPDVVILDPDNLVPLPATNPNAGEDDDPEETPEAGEPGVCGPTYTVEAGDITVNIADKCGVTVEGIEAANPDVDIRSLSIGQVLIMPDPQVIDPEEETPEATP